MVINLNPATSSSANASGSSVGGGSGGGGSVNSQSGSIIGGNGTGSGNGSGNGSGSGNSTGNGSGGAATSNLMGIFSHAVFEGIVHLHVVCAGDSNAKWITLEEAMAYCPTGVVAYTKLQLAEIYGVPMEVLFE